MRASTFAASLKLGLVIGALAVSAPALAPAQGTQAPDLGTQAPSLGTQAPAPGAQAPPLATQTSLEAPVPPLRMEELDQLVAPIALYPDVLLAQVCIASTYPLEVAIAARWQQQNSGLQGEQLAAALNMQTWDPSVKALVQLPAVLQLMNDKLDWTQKLGDAFLAQQTDVMAAIQRLRHLAQSNGQLMTTSQQTVTTMGQTIIIEQTDPEVIYVPTYDPYYWYGTWPYPAYPPYYWPGYGFGLGLGLGIFIGAIWDNHWDWGNGRLEVNPLRNGNIDRGNINRVNPLGDNINRGDLGNRQNWNHQVEHRRGVNYRDQGTRERFGRGDAAGASARRDFRGFDQGQLGQGNIANRASFTQGDRMSGFDGIGNGTRAQSDRGRASVNSMNQSRNRGTTQARSSSGARAGGSFRGGGGGGFRGGGGGRR